jgi:small subunit ribosomal protein S3
VYRGDRLGQGEAPAAGKAEAGEEDRRPRRAARPGAPGGRARPAGERVARTATAAGEGADKPAEAGAESPVKTPVVKRVRKVTAAPADAGKPDGKGE